MILHGYCLYNRKISAYTEPKYEPYDKQLKTEMMMRAYINCKDEDKVLFQESDFYYLGTYDDKTGTFQHLDHPEFICSFGEHNDETK